MAEPLSVVLYGNSLVLEGVGQSLARYPGLRVVSHSSSPTTTPHDLDALHPSAIVVDLGAVSTEFAFALLSERPDLLLIGLDPGGDRLLVLSGRRARSLGTDELVRLIKSKTTVKSDRPATRTESASSNGIGG